MGLQNSYGIKEVADVVFYTINDDGSKGEVKYVFDSLKVSNIEISSEDVSARGGKGNPELISWSYGKEVTFTMEDALFSMDTMALLFGGHRDGETVTVDADTFGGTYYIVGKTYARAYIDGQDYLFTFEIPKAKVNTSGTLTMEAEGDPSTFEMTIKALRSTLGNGDTLVTFTKGDKRSENDCLYVEPNVVLTAGEAKELLIPGVLATDTMPTESGYTLVAENGAITVTASTASTAPKTLSITRGDDAVEIAKITVLKVESAS